MARQRLALGGGGNLASIYISPPYVLKEATEAPFFPLRTAERGSSSPPATAISPSPRTGPALPRVSRVDSAREEPHLDASRSNSLLTGRTSTASLDSAGGRHLSARGGGANLTPTNESVAADLGPPRL